MKFVFAGNKKDADFLRSVAPAAHWIYVEGAAGFSSHKDANAFFDFSPHDDAEVYEGLFAPVFINIVTKTLDEIHAGSNVIRINGWPGFLEKDIWEIAGKPDKNTSAVLGFLGKKFIVVNDEPGFVSARIIAMIINEAYHAKDDNISSEADMDTAMKLGTNYPFGPFEWSRRIGIKNIYELLAALAKTDGRYEPAAALKNEYDQL